MPRTWRAGGIIGPTTAKQNAGAGGVEVWSLERYELEKQKELLVILMKKLVKTLPYWKNWKKTERNFLSAAGGSSMKAFDPCLDTGEVGEGPAVEEVGEPVIESQPEQLKKFEK